MATGPLPDERRQPLRPDADPEMGGFRDGEELSGVFEGACDAESVYCAVLIFLPRMDTDEHGFFSGAVIASERGERGNPLPAAPSVTARGGAHTGDCFGIMWFLYFRFHERSKKVYKCYEKNERQFIRCKCVGFSSGIKSSKSIHPAFGPAFVLKLIWEGVKSIEEYRDQPIQAMIVLKPLLPGEET